MSELRRTPRPPTVGVVICTLNEESNLPGVLPRIPGLVDEIVIVDAHSTDGTVALARELCPSARILYQPGRGKGDALRHGVENVSTDIVVTLDADGQNDPADVERFVTPLLEGYDFAKGSRFRNGHPPNLSWKRWIGNRMITGLGNLLMGTRFSDLCSGYNASLPGCRTPGNLHPSEAGLLCTPACRTRRRRQ